MANDEKDLEAAMGAMEFMNIANSLRDFALKLDEKQKNGEEVDVFGSFQEAMDLIKNPIPDSDVQETDTVA